MNIIVVITVYKVQALEWRLSCVLTIAEDFFFFSADSETQVLNSLPEHAQSS